MSYRRQYLENYQKYQYILVKDNLVFYFIFYFLKTLDIFNINLTIISILNKKILLILPQNFIKINIFKYLILNKRVAVDNFNFV